MERAALCKSPRQVKLGVGSLCKVPPAVLAQSFFLCWCPRCPHCSHGAIPTLCLYSTATPVDKGYTNTAHSSSARHNLAT